MSSKVDHKPTQNNRIIDYLRKRGSITQFEALSELGIMRLASRISDLRRLGYLIESEMVVVKNRFDEECRVKRYRLGGRIMARCGFPSQNKECTEQCRFYHICTRNPNREVKEDGRRKMDKDNNGCV